MTEEELFVVAAFEFEDEAHIVKGHFDAQGIETFVLGSDNSGFGGLSADAAYQIVVKSYDADQAKRILDEMESDEDNEDEVPSWVCECGEDVDEGFAICWSCGSNWPGGKEDEA